MPLLVKRADDLETTWPTDAVRKFDAREDFANPTLDLCMNDPVAFVKRLVPRAIKDPIKEGLRRRRFAKALISFRKLQRDCAPPEHLLEELVEAWGNESYSAQHEYLRELVLTVRKIDGPIVECGSGLTTVLVGLEAQRNGLKHYALENHPEWARRILRDLTAAGVTSTVVYETPLRSYGEYAWYDVSEVELPPKFAMAICDGPPGDTPGGRYGLVPVLQDRLDSGCLIMIDDFQREEEQAITRRWTKETGASFTQHGTNKPFAMLRIP